MLHLTSRAAAAEVMVCWVEEVAVVGSGVEELDLGSDCELEEACSMAAASLVLRMYPGPAEAGAFVPVLHYCVECCC